MSTLLPHPYTREFIRNIWPPQVTPTSQNANKLTTPNWHKIHSANWFKIYSDLTHNSKHKRDIKRNTRQQERFTTSTVTFSHHRTWLHHHKATNWQPQTGTKDVLQTGLRFNVTTPTIQNFEIYIKRNTRQQEKTRQKNPSYMQNNVDNTH